MAQGALTSLGKAFGAVGMGREGLSCGKRVAVPVCSDSRGQQLQGHFCILARWNCCPQPLPAFVSTHFVLPAFVLSSISSMLFSFHTFCPFIHFLHEFSFHSLCPFIHFSMLFSFPTFVLPHILSFHPFLPCLYPSTHFCPSTPLPPKPPNLSFLPQSHQT